MPVFRYGRGPTLTCTNIPHWLLLLLLLAWPTAAVLVYSLLWSRFVPEHIRHREWSGVGSIIVLLASGIAFLRFLVLVCR